MTFWASRRVVVTGGAGFLGSFVSERLRELGCASLFIPRRSNYDLREPGAARRLLTETAPDMIIHLAGRIGGIEANSAHPAEFFYDNLIMGVHLLHESWRLGVEKFVAVGTVCAYPKFTPIPFKEENLWDGYPEETNAPYGLAKKMLLVQSQAYRQQYGFNSIYLLPVNLYGPRDNFDQQTCHVIPSLIQKCLEAKEFGRDEIIVWGSGRQSREFLYVEDAAEGIVRSAEYYDGSEPVNLGSGQETSMTELVNLIARLTGFQGRIVWDTTKPDGQPRRCLDTTRARSEFGFSASTPLEQGLRRTIDWYVAERQSPS